MSRSSTLTILLLIITLGAVSFYSGYRPWLFRTSLGLLLLALTLLAPGLTVWSLRLEDVSWKGSLVIVAFTSFVVIALVYVPSWLFFTYSSALSDGF